MGRSAAGRATALPGTAAAEPSDRTAPPDAADPATGGPNPVDLRLLPGALAAWAVAWTAPLLTHPWLLAFAGAALAAALVAFALSHRTTRLATAALVLVCASATACTAALRASGIHDGPVEALAARGATVTAELTLTDDPDQRATAVVARAHLDRVRPPGAHRSIDLRTPVTVLGAGDPALWSHLLPSTRLRVTGRLVAVHGPGDVAALLSVRRAPVVIGAPDLHQRIAGYLRARLRDATDGLPPAPRGLLPGFVVGDITRVPPDVDEAFHATELTHLTAVSGGNVTMMIAAVLGVLRWAGVRGRLLPLAGGFAIAAFVVLARPDPSVLRAAVMGCVMLAAMYTGRRRAAMPALCAACLVLLLLDPGLARSYGFALSACATAALLLIAPGWTRALHGRGFPHHAAAALAVPAAAQAVCGPIVVAFSGEVSLLAVPCNVLAELAVAPATVLGFFTMLLAVVWLPAAKVVAWVASWPVRWIAWVADTGAGFPGAVVSWPHGVTGSVLLVLAVLALVPVARTALRRPLVAVGCVLVLMVALLRPPVVMQPLTGWPPDGWRMVACDVGQGDALVLDGGEGGAVVVDAGPSPPAVDRCLRDLGVERVALVVLTHFHADHVEGLPGVLRHRVVGGIETTPYAEPVGEAARVRRWASDDGVPVFTAGYGERRTVGPLSWRVVGPAAGAEPDGPNNASLVLLVDDGGVRMLLTGDVEPDAQRELVRETAGARVDVLKVPHHGSAHQDEALIAALRPRVAVVSVGAENSYGHPSARTLRAARAAGARVLRTDRDGDVAVTGDGGSLHVVTRPAPGD